MYSEHTVKVSEVPLDNLSSRLLAVTDRHVDSFARLQKAKTGSYQFLAELSERLQVGGLDDAVAGLPPPSIRDVSM